MNLAQFAVYNVNPKSKRDTTSQPSMHARRHGHQHLHQQHAQKKRAEEDLRRREAVTEFSKSTRPNPAEPEPEPMAPEPQVTQAPSSSATPEPTATSSAYGSVATGDYSRIGYYNAKQGIADGIVFLGNYGGDGSGSFDRYCLAWALDVPLVPFCTAHF